MATLREPSRSAWLFPRQAEAALDQEACGINEGQTILRRQLPRARCSRCDHKYYTDSDTFDIPPSASRAHVAVAA